MHSRRKLVVAGALVVVAVIALVVWRSHRTESSTDGGNRSAESGDHAGSAGDGGGVVRIARPGVHIAGIVVTDGGTPVPGASVRIGSPRVSSGVTSDANGSFDLGTKPVESYLITATLAGRTGASEELDLRDPTLHADQLRLVLYPCDASIHGTVRDAGGGVIQGAQIAHVTDLENSTTGAGAFTGADGTYELCVPPGNAMVIARADGYAPMFDTIAAFGKARRDFTLSPGGTIAGRVVRAGGEPVRDAVVEVYSGPDRAGIPSRAISDDRGRFTVSDLVPGSVEVFATAPGLATEQPCAGAAEVGGAGAEVVCELAPTLAIAGKVIERGVPVPGISVTVMPADFKGNIEHISTDVTQADGSFLLEHVFADEYRPSVGDLQQAFAPIKVGTRSVSGVVLELERGGSITGRVVHAGKPVAGASVQLKNGGRSTTADDGGAFVFDHLPARAYSLYAESHRVGAFTNGPSITLSAGEQRSGIVVELELEGSIEGVVVDQSDRPVAGVVLSFSLLGGSDFGLATSADDGTFAARALSGGGDYLVEIRDRPSGGLLLPPATGKRFPRFAVRDGRTHVTGARIKIRWERLAITGRVADASGQPVADVTVEAISSSQDWMRATTATSDQTGAFAIRDLTAGTYSLRARSAHGAARLASVAAGKTDVVLRLERTGTIEGTLVGFSSSPEVYAHGSDMSMHLRATVTGSSFRVNNAPAGEYNLVATSRGGSAFERVVVAPGAAANVTLTNPGVGSVAGVVLDKITRRPVAGVQCWVQSMIPSGGAMPMSDATGAFRIAEAPPGTHEVACWSKTHHARLEVSIARDDVTHVELLAEPAISYGTPGDAGLTLQDGDGIMVSQVKAGGAAARAGIAVGDIVKSFAGHDAGKLGAAGTLDMIELPGPGTKVKVVLERDDKDLAVELTLDSRPSP